MQRRSADSVKCDSMMTYEKIHAAPLSHHRHADVKEASMQSGSVSVSGNGKVRL